MKKFTLLLMMLVAILTATAQEVTGNAMENFGTTTINKISEFNVAPVTLTFAKNGGSTEPAYNKAGDCRIYAKNTITATCTTGNLTKIVFTISAQGKKRLTDLVPSVGTVTIADDHSTVTWEGNATEVVMTVGEKAVYGTEGASKAGQICFTEFTATYEAGSAAAAAAPSLPAECSFMDSKVIEITNNAEGATVYYTTDGENFNEYTGEFTITETTTVTAFAQVGDDETTKSNEVTRTYTKLEVKTIAEVVAAGAGTAATKGTVAATYAKGFLLSDETGYILVYQGSAPTAAEGDVININGTTSMYGGLLQFATGANIEKTGTAEVTRPEAIVMDGAALDAFLTAPEVKFVEYIGTLNINNGYYNVVVEGTENAQGSIQYPNEGLVTVENGTVVKVTGYTIGVSSSKYVNTMAVKVEAYVEPEPELPALEITGYTPTEAVEKLETITITFNDEIEGTFEMMAMSQIYLGAKSNGCSYTVEGNVLTITPFNAITTPGEYALVIPEGLITRKANGEAIVLNGDIKFTVKEATVEPTTGIEAGKLYRIKASNGEYLTIGDSNANTHGHVHGATLDETNNNQVFTFIAVEGQENTYYVQSAAGKYFSYEGVGTGWNVNATEDVALAHELIFEAAEGKLQYFIKCYNAAKNDYKYFKYEYVSASGKSHPYNDADIDKAEVWTLEEVAAAEPELPALEITGYTPTEAVEKLETITITFNDEIEGTFEMMAMSQIYLGAKSNGCSFAVESNVLTITPFNAITTPGEYALVIPEGLITRKANGEAIVLNGDIKFTVKEATVEPEPTATFAIYHITAKDAARGALYATAESTHLTHCGATYGNYHNRDIAVNAEDVNQQFVFVEYEGMTYMYSLGAKKFASRESQYIKLTENPEGFVTVEDADAEGYKLILFNGQNRLNFSGGYDHGCVANYETPDDGNRLALTEVGQYDATELLASIEAYFKAKAEALAAARAAFDAKYTEAQAILAEAALSVVESELPLQVADATAAGYIWCNNPDPGEGPIAQLVDGIAEEGNFFHSSWRGGGEEPHYIEVDLGEGNGLAEFSFKYTTRFAVANDYPDAIQVMGSNDKETYNELYSVTSGLPQTGGTQWTSNIISSETAYRYLRFNVDAERTYWHMSEFDIVTSEISVAEKYAAVANSVVALDNAFKAAADNSDYTAEELYAAAAAINAAIVEIYKDEATVALIATAKELITLEGIGYPAAAPRAELQAAIDAAEAMPNTEAGTALQAAINAYYAATDVVLPENGKVYTFKAVYGNNKFYIYNNNGTLAVAACGDEELPESAKFICEYDSEDDFMFQFKTADGAYYLAYPTLGGKGWLDNESETGLEATSSRVTKFNINKILAGGEVAASNEALLGLVQMDGYRGYDNGKYVDTYGPIVVQHSAATFDGANAPYYNENFTSAFCIEESEVVVTPLSVVAVTPNEAVETLQEITIEFDAEIAVDSVNVRACTIDYGWGVIIGTTATVEGNILKLVSDTPIKDKGQYPLTIPADVVKRASDGVAYEGGKFEFEVKEKAVEPLTVVKVTPEAEVRTLEVITIEFSHNVFVNAMGTAVATIANADNSVKVTFSPMDIQCEGNIVTFDLGENAITVAGEYTLDIPSGIIARNDGVKYSGTHTFTVVAPKTFAVNAYIFPTVEGDVTEIKAIRVEANQGASLSDLPTDWTFTNEEGKEFEMNIQWLTDFTDLFISFNPAITEAGTYTLTIPAGSLKTDDGKECEAATFQFTVNDTTGIEGVDAEGEQTIYDLTGRKIETITKGGIYIVNGKKVLVK